MRFIRSIIRTFLAWTFFVFALGAIVPLALKRPQQALHDLGVLVFWIFGLYILSVLARAFLGAVRSGRAGDPVADPGIPTTADTMSGQGVTAVTVFVGAQPGQVAAAVSEMPAGTIPFVEPSYDITARSGDVGDASETDLHSERLVFEADEIPGARGARMALSGPEESQQPGALAITYRGELKAYVTRESWEQVGDFADLAPDDPEYRLVALMAVYAQNVLLGFETQYSEQDAIAYALGELVRPREILERDIPNPWATAESCGVPVEVLQRENLRALRDALDKRAAAEALAEQQAER